MCSSAGSSFCNLDILPIFLVYLGTGYKSSWRNRLARSTVNREVVGSIPTEDVHFDWLPQVFEDSSNNLKQLKPFKFVSNYYNGLKKYKDISGEFSA